MTTEIVTPLHSALAAIKADDDYAVARARALITAYHMTWGNIWANDYQVLEVEKEFSFPLLNPETEAPSRSFDEGGKIDVLVRHIATDRVKVVEHKTSSDSVAPDSNYWDRLRMDTQCSKYYMAALQQGHNVDSVIYDVVRKPAHRPSQIPVLDEDGMKMVFDQQGNRVMTANGKKPRETADAEKGWVLQTLPETPAQFEHRLLSVLVDKPGDYFAQRETTRLDRDLLEYMQDTWQTSQQILYFRKAGVFPRNPDACTAMGTCEMLDLCSGRASVDGVRYRVKRHAHPELKGQQGLQGHELLTTSRTKALRKCARLHKLRYDDKIERVGEDSEALAFGSLMHVAWEAYFNHLKQNYKTT